jgi:hypothetical protein
MSIEVKQMLVKSTVLSGQRAGLLDDHRERAADLAVIRAAILDQCRQMIADVLREQQER